MHKKSPQPGNFILSLSGFRASIPLHVKTPDNGGAALSREFRLDGEATRRVGDLRVPDLQEVPAVSRRPWFPHGSCRTGLRAASKAQRPSGRSSAGSRATLRGVTGCGGYASRLSGDGAGTVDA